MKSYMDRIIVELVSDMMSMPDLVSYYYAWHDTEVSFDVKKGIAFSVFKALINAEGTTAKIYHSETGEYQTVTDIKRVISETKKTLDKVRALDDFWLYPNYILQNESEIFKNIYHSVLYGPEWTAEDDFDYIFISSEIAIKYETTKLSQYIIEAEMKMGK